MALQGKQVPCVRFTEDKEGMKMAFAEATAKTVLGLYAAASLILAPLGAHAQTGTAEGRLYEELDSERSVVGHCESDRLEAAAYVVKPWGRGYHVGARTYYFFNDEKTPFLTYYGEGRWGIDLDRDGTVDKQVALKVEDIPPEWFCNVVKQLKR